MVGAHRRTATTIATFFVALFCFGAASAPVEQRSFAPGDTVIYDFNLEVQMHAIGADPRTSMTSDASGAGTETLSIDRVDADGTAHGLLKVVYQGTADGQPVDVAQSWRAALTPEGEIRADAAQPLLGEDIDQALGYINGVSKGFGARALVSGSTWKTGVPTGGAGETMTVMSRVTGLQKYQTYQASVIEQTARGQFVAQIAGAPASGTIATGGTVYYDAALGLLIGCAVRGQTDVAVAGTDVKHISKTETVNLQLRSWKQGGALAVTAVSTATPNATAATSTPAPQTPAPVYTQTPSPIATGR
jgi:hypothetical protein